MVPSSEVIKTENINYKDVFLSGFRWDSINTGNKLQLFAVASFQGLSAKKAYINFTKPKHGDFIYVV